MARKFLEESRAEIQEGAIEVAWVAIAWAIGRLLAGKVLGMGLNRLEPSE